MNVYLTFDYEVFGDGAGSYIEDVVSPMSEILKVCDSKNIKSTIFFEILEYLRINESWSNEKFNTYDSNPCEAVKKQIHQAYMNGHQIELHIHPQWYDAELKEGKWLLDMKNWSLGLFSHKRICVKDLITFCKIELEKLMHEIDPNYQVNVFRAGAYNVQPSHKIYTALIENNIKLDSSVYPGGFENSLSKFNFQNHLNLDFWKVNPKDFSVPGKSSLVELPIYSKKILRIFRLFDVFKERKKSTRVFPISSNASQAKKLSLFQKIKFLFSYEFYPWDITMFSKKMHLKYISSLKRFKTRREFVLIGHPKSLPSNKCFQDFVNLAYSNKFKFKRLCEFDTDRSLKNQF